MADHRIGTVFVELDLDPSRYMKGQQTLLKEAQNGATRLEKNFKNLGIQSDATFDLMRARAEKSFQAIANSSKSTADDILRAERAKNDALTRLNEQQFGAHTSLLSGLKAHYIAVTATIAGSVGLVMKAWDMAKVGAEYDEQRGILDNLGRKYKTTADGIVSDMRRAAEGQIANADLMQVALGGIAKGLKPEQLTNLADAAKVLGDVVGKDATTALKELTEALETGRARGLKGYLGSALDLKDVFGDLEGKLTAAEKAQAMYNLTMIQANKLQAEQSGKVDESADKIERLEAKWKNLTTEVSRYVKAVVISGAEIFSSTEGAFGGPELPSTTGPFFRGSVGPRPPAGGWEAQNAAIKAAAQARKDAEDAAKKTAAAQEQVLKERERLELAARSKAGGTAEDWAYAPLDEKGWLEVENRSIQHQEKIYAEQKKQVEDVAKIQRELRAEEERDLNAYLSASKTVYGDLRKSGQDYYDIEAQLIEQRAEKFREAGVDQAAIDAWTRDQMEQNWIRKGRASDDFFAGIQAGFMQARRDAMTWGEAGYKTVADFSSSSRDAFKTMFTDASKGELQSFSDYFNVFCDSMKTKLIDTASSMASDWAMSGIGSLFGMGNPDGSWWGGGGWGGGEGGMVTNLAGRIPVVGGFLSDVSSSIGGFVEDIPVVGDLLGGLFHKGGIVGRDYPEMRAVPASTFANAPRAHGGLGPGERAIIAKNDEGIFTPAQMKALGGGRSMEVHIHVLDKEFVGTIRGEAEKVIIARNGRKMSTSTQRVYS